MSQGQTAVHIISSPTQTENDKETFFSANEEILLKYLGNDSLPGTHSFQAYLKPELVPQDPPLLPTLLKLSLFLSFSLFLIPTQSLTSIGDLSL